ncbi:hypothetical protein [uncultured Methanoculleus sp.]|jgi:hypothetical protein|uniref:CheW-like domain-containing protein n=1 Tax=Methanoculleus palmolei TaxID=72612 RepID=A0ABD8A874_9EURY|nr:hypothetical protein [Methanoculleus sp. UBA377]MDD2472672.1 hypothetical protein [Methanoculleus sp.]WOX55355.1 hypothetical protein R6Y95_07750 [Methanoculleus palmolei]
MCSEEEGEYPGEIDVPVSQCPMGITGVVVIVEMDMQGSSYGEELIQHSVDVSAAEIQAEREPCFVQGRQEGGIAEMAHLPASHVLHGDRHPVLLLDCCKISERLSKRQVRTVEKLEPGRETGVADHAPGTDLPATLQTSRRRQSDACLIGSRQLAMLISAVGEWTVYRRSKEKQASEQWRISWAASERISTVPVRAERVSRASGSSRSMDTTSSTLTPAWSSSDYPRDSGSRQQPAMFCNDRIVNGCCLPVGRV